MTENNRDSLYYAHEYLEAKFNNGEFDQMITHLFDRLRTNKDEILKRFKSTKASSEDDKLKVIESFLKEKKSLHLPSELADQIREISKEVWIQGEKGKEDIPRIKEEWAQKHATSWRQARVIEMQFLTYRMKDKVLDIFK